MTTLNDLSIISDFVYGDSTEKIPEPWVLKLDSGEHDSGYRGMAFYDPTTGDVAIGNRGTRPTSLKDLLLSDTAIALGILNFAEIDASEFAKKVLATFAEEKVPVRTLYITGHSLGGAEASYAAMDLTHLGVAVKAITFNAPGLPKSVAKKGVRYDIVDISARTDWIHNFGGDAPRHERHIPAERIDWGPLSKPGIIKKILTPITNILDGFKGHSMDGVRAFFLNHRDLAQYDAAKASVMPQKYINEVVAKDKEIAKASIKAAEEAAKLYEKNKESYVDDVAQPDTTLAG